MEHALSVADIAMNPAAGNPPRICWETNGSMAPSFLEKVVALSRRSGGVVKFDLKAFSECLHRTLTGVSPQPTRDNFRQAFNWSADWSHDRPLVASTVLVPGYVDEVEISRIARFIADVSPHIPYALLAFGPHYAMSDLPRTSRGHANRCLEAAQEAGLTRVHLGNRHLLGPADY